MGIKDVWEASDAYKFAVEQGHQYYNESTSVSNFGNAFSSGNQQRFMSEMPIAGIASQIPVFVDGGIYTAEAGGEIHPSLYKFALNISFRFLNQSEYATVQANSNGNGYRCQRLQILLLNQAVQTPTNTYTLIDIFADYGYYVTQVGAAPPLANAYVIDMQQPPEGLAIGQINNLVFIDELPAAMLRNRSCQSFLRMTYYIQQNGDGNTWTAPPASNYAGGFIYDNGFIFSDAVNPATGFEQGGAGLLACQLNLYHDGTAITPTGTPTVGTFSRVVTGVPIIPDAEMGDSTNVAVFSDLRLKARAALNASFPACSMGYRLFGGVKKPIVGNSGVFNDSAIEQLTTYVQVPEGATSYVMIAKVRTISGAGNHTVTGTLTNQSGSASFNPLLSNQFAGTGERWIYVNAALPLNMLPNTEEVQRWELVLKSEKSSPRAPQQTHPYQADGIFCFYLGFYS